VKHTKGLTLLQSKQAFTNKLVPWTHKAKGGGSSLKIWTKQMHWPPRTEIKLLASLHLIRAPISFDLTAAVG